jgi:hypothetical protein
MKKVVAVIVFVLSSYWVQAQNLVPNPSFEIYDTCPDYFNQIGRAVEWFASRSTPDYFNACASASSGFSVPNNIFGYRIPASGNGYSGIIAKFAASNTTEHLGIQLSSTLQISTKYYVSFKVSLAGQGNQSSYCGINKLGALFSTAQFSGLSLSPVCNCPQIFSNSIITDTLNWTRILGSFVADSSYSFIYLGRFFDNSSTDSIQITGSMCSAYYYIDDVCVSDDSSYASNYAYNNISDLYDSNFILFPNPARDNITLKNLNNRIEELVIYNLTGQIVLSRQIENVNEYTINLADILPGIYNLIVCEKGSHRINHLIVKL